VLDIAPRIIS